VPHRSVELELALRDGGGVLARRDHVRLVPAIDHALRAGRLRALLPGVYVGAGAAPDLAVRARALMAWSPDAVLTGRAAARLAFWPDLAVDDVEAAARRVQAQTPGYRLERRAIDPELVLERDVLRSTPPALTALDLCSTLGGDASTRSSAAAVRASPSCTTFSTGPRSGGATASAAGSCSTRAMSRGQRPSGARTGCCAKPVSPAGSRTIPCTSPVPGTTGHRLSRSHAGDRDRRPGARPV
jgi:hypothetical protein